MVLYHVRNVGRILKLFFKLLAAGIVPYALLYLYLRDTNFPSKNAVLDRLAKNLAGGLQTFGPTFIKLGQVLATRPDLVGEKIAKQLEDLQDKLTAFDYKIVEQRIQEALGAKLDSIFHVFEKVPVAAASVAQVHYAELHDGSRVAVKVLRPDIMVRFKKDLELFAYLQKIIEHLLGEKAKRLRLHAVINALNELAKFELNLRYEAAAADEIRHNMNADGGVVIPAIYWEFTTQTVLVMQWVDGISLKNISALQEAGHDLHEIAKKLAVVFFNQAYRDGLFHADLHPGNLFVNADGNIVMVDFGIVGMLSVEDRAYIAKIIYGFINRNYQEVADLHFKAGYIAQEQNAKLFALACRSVGEPIIGLPVNQISIAQLLKQLLEITKYFAMPTQPQLILLQKTMVTLEGVGMALYPEVNMWKLAEPWIESWAKDNFGVKARIKNNAQQVALVMHKLPGLVLEASVALKQFNLHKMAAAVPDLEAQIYESRARVSSIQGFALGVICGLVAFYLWLS